MLKLDVVLAVVMAFVAGAASARGDGTEVGNAVVPYHNHPGKFSISYPQHWTKTEQVAEVTVKQPEPMPNAGAVTFSAIALEGVQTLPQLKIYVMTNEPGHWAPFQIDGHDGFIHKSNGTGLAYVVKQGGDVVRVDFQYGPTPDTAVQVDQILGSLQFD